MTTYSMTGVDQMKAARNSDGLIEALSSDKDEKMRAAAAEALGEIGSTEVAAPLANALLDPARRVRQAAVDALAKFGIYNETGINILTTLVDLDLKTRRVWVKVIVERLNQRGTGDGNALEKLAIDVVPGGAFQSFGSKLLCFLAGLVLWVVDIVLAAGALSEISGPRSIGLVSIAWFVFTLILVFAMYSGWNWFSQYRPGSLGSLIKAMALFFLMGTIVGWIPMIYWTGKGVLSRLRRR